jgi:hypothetical protein
VSILETGRFPHTHRMMRSVVTQLKFVRGVREVIATGRWWKKQAWQVEQRDKVGASRLQVQYLVSMLQVQ